MNKIKGWRKLLCWALIYALVAASTHFQKDIMPEAKALLWGATLFLFAANTTGKFSPAVRDGKEEA